MLSETWVKFFKAFPFTYLVEGFRQAFMENSTIITEQNFVPVVDDRGAFIGIITRKDVIKESLKKTDDVDSTINQINIKQ